MMVLGRNGARDVKTGNGLAGPRCTGRHYRPPTFGEAKAQTLDFFAETGERHLSNPRRFLRLLGVQGLAGASELAPG